MFLAFLTTATIVMVFAGIFKIKQVFSGIACLNARLLFNAI